MTAATGRANGAASLRLDVLSAYAASGARIISWMVVSALVFRAGAAPFAILALVRATAGFLNYTSLGIGPALIHLLARNRAESSSQPTAWSARTVLASGLAMAALTAAVGVLALGLYVALFTRIHAVPAGFVRQATLLALFTGLGTLLRLASDAPGAMLQVNGRIAFDNALLAAAEAVWVICVAAAPRNDALLAAGVGHLLSGIGLLAARWSAARIVAGAPLAFWRHADRRPLLVLLKFGALTAAAQAADFLYAPTDYILINRLIGPTTVAVYAPAMQIDSGLLLLVSGLAAVLLPRTALAHAAGEAKRVRTYYLRGTLASAALLASAAVVIWFASPLIFRIWLGDSLPETRRILPWVLLHSVVGGSAMVGRAVLLATGRVRAFTLSVLVAGVVNVLISFTLVRFAGLGLLGIVLGTLIASGGRCLIWTPWFVLRAIGGLETSATPTASDSPFVPSLGTPEEGQGGGSRN